VLPSLEWQGDLHLDYYRQLFSSALRRRLYRFVLPIQAAYRSDVGSSMWKVQVVDGQELAYMHVIPALLSVHPR
jgi:hypothetical protein